MRYLVLLSLLGATCFGAQPPPQGVDGLSPEDVAKAVSALKENFVRPEALSDAETARATLQGFLDRLTPAASLVTGSAGADAASPFHGETYNGTTGYLGLGDLTPANVERAKQSLKEWSGKGIGAVVLDLRGTPAKSDYESGAELAGFFCPKGTEMFSLTAGKGRTDSNTQPRTFSSEADPLFKGIVVVLVDAGTAETAEAVAACLRSCAKALVVGDETAGRMFQYSEFPLSGAVLRVAVAQVILPDGKEPGESGLSPDIAVALGTVSKKEVMQSITAKGVSSVIEEHDRAHLTEAALVSGSNPEIDEIEQEQAGKKPPESLIDRQLQRALDLVTSISIYQAKGAKDGGE